MSRVPTVESIANAIVALEKFEDISAEAIALTPALIRGAIAEPLHALIAWANAITELATTSAGELRSIAGQTAPHSSVEHRSAGSGRLECGRSS